MRVSKEKQRLSIVGLLLLWCVALIAFRLYLAADLLAIGLLWNLFLAAVPLFWSSAFESALACKRMVLAGVFFVLWLLFLPNAPYILTDLIHLVPRPYVPLWYLLAMLLACAGTGTLLGYLSLSDVHRAIDRSYGKTTGWVVAVACLMLCGFGIYVGRFLRWNSWNALTHPLQLLKTVAGQFMDAGPHPHPLGVSFVFGTGLVLGYLALRALATSLCTAPEGTVIEGTASEGTMPEGTAPQGQPKNTALEGQLIDGAVTR